MNRLFAFFFTALFLSHAAHAQLRFEIHGVGSNQIPIAIAAFADEGVAPHVVSNIIKSDLGNSGYFKIIDTGVAISETSSVNLSDWKARGANALVVGSVQRLADGRLDVRYRLLDTSKNSQISSLSKVRPAASVRLSAHEIADDIYEKLLGIKGIFATRIAYIVKSGKDYRLEVADSDGEGRISAVNSTEPIISPAWSPDGTKVAYVSFEHKKPVVYVQDLSTGRRSVIANYKGNNSAPSWSPDGGRLAIALSRDGNTQIYITNADGSGVRRLTNSHGIDTEPQFSADGQQIYFTSDRGGGPQIYRMSANGGDAQRVSFNGSYNISPRLSPDGKTLAYISRRDGKFQLYALDLTSGQEIRLSDTTKDESPSFAANGKYIMYATEVGRRATLEVVSVDKSIRYSLTPPAGDIREPTWGPFMK